MIIITTKTEHELKLHEVRGFVPYDIKEQIELDALKLLTSQKTIVGMAISQYYSDQSEITSTNIKQKFNYLCKKTTIFHENIAFLQKNNSFEVEITEILSVFKHQMNTISYDHLRESLFKELIDLIIEYKTIFPDRSKKIDIIVKKYVSKALFKFYLDEFNCLTVLKSGNSDRVVYNSIKGTCHTTDVDNKEHILLQNGEIPVNENVQQINIDDVNCPDAPMVVVSELLDNMECTPKQHWVEVITRCKEYIKTKYVNTDDCDTTLDIFDLGQKKLYRERFEQVD